MQTSDFNVFVDKFPFLKDHFLGVFALNTIPTRMKAKSCLIFNLDKSNEEGSHWLALIHTKKNYYELFDSLGVKIEQIRPFLKFSKPILLYNTGVFQSSSTSTCGLYSLYYIVHRMMNINEDYEEMLQEMFSINIIENEQKVFSFFKNVA